MGSRRQLRYVASLPPSLSLQRCFLELDIPVLTVIFDDCCPLSITDMSMVTNARVIHVFRTQRLRMSNTRKSQPDNVYNGITDEYTHAITSYRDFVCCPRFTSWRDFVYLTQRWRSRFGLARSFTSSSRCCSFVAVRRCASTLWFLGHAIVRWSVVTTLVVTSWRLSQTVF